MHADYRRFLDALDVPDGLVLEVKPGIGLARSPGSCSDMPGLLRSTFYLEAYARFNGLAPALKSANTPLHRG